MNRNELVAYADELLEVKLCKDYCPNGLQVEGRAEVRKIVSGVTASLALIEAACKAQADVLLVHHGYFWKSENPCIVGMKAHRITALLKSSINLLAYHLPLDIHPTLGNNRQFGDRLGIRWLGALAPEKLVNFGELPASLTSEEFANKLSLCCKRAPMHIASLQDQPIQKVAWCTGAAQGYLEAAAAMGVDAYVTGEVSEASFHMAKELGIHFFCAGHHATERFGVQALGEHLANTFSLQHEFIDLDNPV